LFSCSTGRFGIAAYLSAAAIPKTSKADARTNAPPDTGERDVRHVGFESDAVNRVTVTIRYA
jgi:hypothetical protein